MYRGFRLYALAAFSAITPIVFGATVVAQATYVPVNVSTPDPEGFVTVASPATCDNGTNTVPDGGYVRQWTQQNPLTVNLDARSQITGVCQFWIGSVHYPQYDTIRGIARIDIDYVRPGPVQEDFYRYPMVSELQDYDTRNPPPKGNGTISRTPADSGTYTVTFQTIAHLTNCQIPPESAVVTRTFNAVPCKPVFATDSNNNIARVAPTTIKINLPSTMSAASAALNAAVTAWTISLVGRE